MVFISLPSNVNGFFFAALLFLLFVRMANLINSLKIVAIGCEYRCFFNYG